MCDAIARYKKYVLCVPVLKLISGNYHPRTEVKTKRRALEESFPEESVSKGQESW